MRPNLDIHFPSPGDILEDEGKRETSMGINWRISAGALCLCLSLSVRAQLYQGTVKEALYGSGVDSVSVTVKRTGARVFTDSAGRYSLLSTALARSGRGAPELLWLAGS